MSRLLTRHFWIIHLLFWGVASWLAARLITIVIQYNLSTIPPSPSISAPTPPYSLPPKEIPYQKYSLITERNIFNPTEKGLPLLPLGEIKKSGGEEKALGTSKAGPDQHILMGTITGPGENSYAVIQEAADKKQRIYRLYENIGEGRIVQICRDRVIVKNKGQEEILMLTVKREKEIKRPPLPAGSSQKEDIVRRLSANRFLVNKEDVVESVGNINRFMTQARFRPYFALGQPSGYIISEIVPGSLFEKIGLRNNDIIKKVNGQMINRPEEVYQAYAQLLKDSQIEVEIERGGRSEVFRYEIR